MKETQRPSTVSNFALLL